MDDAELFAMDQKNGEASKQSDTDDKSILKTPKSNFFRKILGRDLGDKCENIFGKSICKHAAESFILRGNMNSISNEVQCEYLLLVILLLIIILISVICQMRESRKYKQVPQILYYHADLPQINPQQNQSPNVDPYRSADQILEQIQKGLPSLESY